MTHQDQSKGIILFIHGFGSSHRCWQRILELLRSDDRIAPRYDLATWDYPTKWFEMNVLGRIPRLQELGRALGDELDSPRYRGRPVTLVGHSQGGLVIQSYFVELLQAGRGSRLRDIAQAILFATPSEGSTTAMSLRRILSAVFRNPQEITLRVLDPDVADMRAVIRERVVAATRDTDLSWRVPIHAFSGMQDDIVPEASARGPFDSVKRVKGTHFSILQPEDLTDPRYGEFAELLLDPGGHPHRFEVERYETTIRVEPRDHQTIRTVSEKNPRDVEFDNVASIRRRVRFADGNRCTNPFTIRYSTRSGGYVVGHASHANEAPPAEKGRADDTGTFYQFDFTPRPGAGDYVLAVDVYKGFDEGERELHFHLGDHSHYRHMVYVLDLSRYVAGGHVVTRPPELYLHPEDHEHGELCRTRGARDPLAPASSTPDGIYTWELHDIRRAIVDIVWDVAELGIPAVAGGAREAEETPEWLSQLFD
jgi:pimeloyl-ACP methyl ester carboxylesterase